MMSLPILHDVAEISASTPFPLGWLTGSYASWPVVALLRNPHGFKSGSTVRQIAGKPIALQAYGEGGNQTMKTTAILALALCMTICVASASFAQGGMRHRGGPGWGGRLYDPKSVETVIGEVVSVEEIHGKAWAQAGGGRGGGYGIHLIVKSEKEEMAVHLGPSWYLDKHGLKIAPGDRIEVRGSRIAFEGKPAIIAAEVKKDDESLKLRDDNGLPAWRGQGRPRRGKRL